jgi:hypothetical protein
VKFAPKPSCLSDWLDGDNADGLTVIEVLLFGVLRHGCYGCVSKEQKSRTSRGTLFINVLTSNRDVA